MQLLKRIFNKEFFKRDFVIAMLAVSFSGLEAVTRYALPAGIGILLFSLIACC